ncbi:MAG: DUF5703 domain-containing protein [Tepidisphaeraceae bacterium]
MQTLLSNKQPSRFKNLAIIMTALTITGTATAADITAALSVLPRPVVWTTPSENARGSMPLGNGDIALNAWVEPNGDLLFYIGKTDSWEDNARLAKVGLVRVQLNPALPTNQGFEQTLDAATGEMRVTTGKTDDTRCTVRLWVDANQPVVRVTVDSARPVTATASYRLWRDKPTKLPSIEVSDVQQTANNKPLAPTIVEPDTRLTEAQGEVGWYHFNRRSVGPRETLEYQNMLMPDFADPILHRIFGAIVRSPNGRRSEDGTSVQSPSGTQHRFDVAMLTQQPSTPEKWLADIRKIADAAAKQPEQALAAHRDWWKSFWQRSYVQLSSADAKQAPDAAAVEQGYAMQRFITACAGRGAFPIKFNGSLFTVPWPGKPGDADYRRWGPGYWWQNTRLPYSPLATSGDYDLLQPFYKFYGHDLLNIYKERTKRYYRIDNAAFYSELAYFWGAVFTRSYGREGPAVQRADPIQTAGFHKRHWTAGMELSFMMLDYYEHTLDEKFLNDTLLPTAEAVLNFYDRYYKVGPDGKMILDPSQVLETYFNTVNPAPEIAGLMAVTDRLLALPPDKLPADFRKDLTRFKAKIPPLPVREVDGVMVIDNAAKYDPKQKKNVENGDLYPIFPYRIVSFEKPTAATGIETLHRRIDKGPFGWRYEDPVMAYLGLADEARDYLVQRVNANKDPRETLSNSPKPVEKCRFPAFWGPNYDWTPDQCHGGVVMKTLQAMLIQSEGDKIFLLPAWPTDWDTTFKLHAPKNTVVEATVKSGKLVAMTVTPAERQKDVAVNPRFQ